MDFGRIMQLETIIRKVRYFCGSSANVSQQDEAFTKTVVGMQHGHYQQMEALYNRRYEDMAWMGTSLPHLWCAYVCALQRSVPTAAGGLALTCTRLLRSLSPLHRRVNPLFSGKLRSPCGRSKDHPGSYTRTAYSASP